MTQRTYVRPQPDVKNLKFWHPEGEKIFALLFKLGVVRKRDENILICRQLHVGCLERTECQHVRWQCRQTPWTGRAKHSGSTLGRPRDICLAPLTIHAQALTYQIAAIIVLWCYRARRRYAGSKHDVAFSTRAGSNEGVLLGHLHKEGRQLVACAAPCSAGVLLMGQALAAQPDRRDGKPLHQRNCAADERCDQQRFRPGVPQREHYPRPGGR